MNIVRRCKSILKQCLHLVHVAKLGVGKYVSSTWNRPLRLE